MSLCACKRKTCNRVNIRHDLALRVAQTRQSSITRAVSAQAGTTRAGAPAAANATRPRLNAIASSVASNAASSAVSLAVAGLELARKAFVRLPVQMVMVGAAPVAALAIDTRRVARVQRMVTC